MIPNFVRKLINGPYPKWLPHVLVGLVYVFFTCYYMGPSITNCKDTLYGFGDNTAGPIWRYTVSPDKPLWGFQEVTNYPVGESLSSPVNYSGFLQYTLFWGAAKAVGPVCGYNVVNIIGFVASAMVMYGFIYAITKRRWIAILAGFAASFSPYYQMKVGGHPSYGFQALLIGVIWAFYNLVKKQRKRDALLLAGVTAACFYFDPYFSLLATISLIALFAVWALLGIWQVRKRRLKQSILLGQLKLMLLAALFTVLLLAPLLFVSLTKSKEISSSVAAVRGNVLFEATACSNLPHEYALPFVLHPVFSKVFGRENYPKLIDELHGGFDCGIGEDTVGVSLMVLSVVAIGLVVISWETLNKRRLKFALSQDKKLLVLGLAAVGLAGLIMALPPIRIGKIPTPTYALLMLTSTWRTLTRFYLLVNIASVALFAIFLAYFSAHFRKYRRWLIAGFCLIFLIILVEYQAFRPFSGNKLSTFSYSKDVPEVYNWLRDQSDLREIAEYPLERTGGESNAMAYYLSMQVTHKKKLFNANNPISQEENLRSSLKDISDTQTIRVLSALGIDAVVIHGVEEKEIRKIPGLEVIYSAPQATFNMLAYTPLVKNDNVVVVRVLKQSPIQTMLAFESGFVRNTNVIKSAIDWEYEALNGSILKVAALPGGNKDQVLPASKQCFAIRMAGDNDTGELLISSDGVSLPARQLTSSYQRVQVEAKDSIVITNSKGFNMRVKDLGCGEAE